MLYSLLTMFSQLSYAYLKLTLSEESADWLSSYAYLDEVGSTNSYLLERAKTNVCAGCVVIAGEQTAGRGQFDRAWSAPKGRNLTLSFAFDLKDVNVNGFSLIIGLGLHRALVRLGVLHATVKWPNDVMVQNQKIAGILVETLVRSQSTLAIVGIGLNVDLTDLEIQSLNRPVTDLKRCHVNVSAEILVATILEEVIGLSLRFLKNKGDLNEFLSLWDSADYLAGRHVQMTQTHGVIVGVASGITGQGALKIKTMDQQIHTVVCGELKVLNE